MPVLAVLGYRNLGRAILGHFRADGWEGAAIARSAASLEGIDGLGVRADASDPAALRGALGQVREQLGGLDLVVNAVSAARPPHDGGAFGGGPLAEATLEGFRGWGGAVAEQAFVFLSEGGRALREAGGGTLVQVTGGSARRAMPGRGLWAAGAAATRALTHSNLATIRAYPSWPCSAPVDATIDSPETQAMTRGKPPEATAGQLDVARPVAALAAQGPRGMTHELVITPAGDRWVP